MEKLKYVRCCYFCQQFDMNEEDPAKHSGECSEKGIVCPYMICSDYKFDGNCFPELTSEGDFV